MIDGMHKYRSIFDLKDRFGSETGNLTVDASKDSDLCRHSFSNEKLLNGTLYWCMLRRYLNFYLKLGNSSKEI